MGNPNHDAKGRFASKGASRGAGSSSPAKRMAQMFKAKGGKIGKNGKPYRPLSSKLPRAKGPSKGEVAVREMEARTGMSIAEIRRKNAAAVKAKYGK